MNLIKRIKIGWSALIEEITALEATPKRLRSFGVVIGGILLVFALYLLWIHGTSLVVFGALGVFLIVTGLATPKLLRLPYRAWMLVALLLGHVISPLILSLLFVVVLIPIGLLRRFIGSDPLHRKFDKEVVSYWIPHEKRSLDHMHRPF